MNIKEHQAYLDIVFLVVAVAQDKLAVIEETRQKLGPVRAYIRCVGKELPRIRLPHGRILR